jgi:non-ribosomal peptide synthetase component E (peptide arylation enzyme)
MNEWTTVITEAGDVAPIGEIGLLARRGHVPSVTTRMRRRRRRHSSSSTVCAGRFPAIAPVIEDDGAINVLGRGSQCINTGGEKVFPEEVERC